MELLCYKCQKNSVPAPPGATGNTRYICRECSPLGPDELRFDSCQFDKGMLPLSRYGPEARFNADGLRIEAQPTDTAEAVEIIRRRIMAGENISLPAAIRKAAENGEVWARSVEAKNLVLLSERVLQAFLLFYWGDFSHAQVASEMSIAEQVSRNFVTRAKARLVAIGGGKCSGT